MTKHHWSIDIKNEAIQLRKQGYSYSQITKSLGVVKSTLNSWLRNLPKPKEYQFITGENWLKKIRPLALAANKRKNDEIAQIMINKINSEVKQIKVDGNLEKAVLTMLYWAEGSKVNSSVLIFANIDPKLVLLFITLLRRCYQIDETKFRVRLHLHSYHKELIIKRFWSNLLKIPESQFGKTYRKKRSKEKTFRRNFGGICFLKYNSTYLQREITRFAVKLGEKISGEINVPVA